MSEKTPTDLSLFKRAGYCDYCRTDDGKPDPECFACQGSGHMLLCTNCEEDTQRILGTSLCRECDIDLWGSSEHLAHRRAWGRDGY